MAVPEEHSLSLSTSSSPVAAAVSLARSSGSSRSVAANIFTPLIFDSLLVISTVLRITLEILPTLMQSAESSKT